MRLMTGSCLALLVPFAVALTGCADADATAGDEGTASAALFDAPQDPGHKFAVGVCSATLLPDGSCPVPGTPGTVRCSGTLVTPNLVLTARHCVEKMGPPADPAVFCSGVFTGEPINTTIQVTTSDTVLQPGATWFNVKAVHNPPGNNNCTDDVVLLELEKKVKNVAPAGIDLHRNVAKHPPPEVAIVGRGAIKEKYDPATFERIEFDNGNIFRRVLEHVPYVCGQGPGGPACTVEDYFSAPPSFTLPVGLFAYGKSAGVGDSGAGVFPQGYFSGHLYWVIGVNTLGTMSAEGDISGSQAVRLDQHAPYIRQVVKQAAAAGPYLVPLWAL